MAAYITARAVAVASGVLNIGLVIYIGKLIVKLSCKVDSVYDEVALMKKEIDKSDTIKQTLDKAITLAQSGKGSTSVEVKGGNANER